MTPILQRVLRLAAVAFALAAVMAPYGASAQQYPSRDIRFICAFPPGSGADVLVRFFAELAQERFLKDIKSWGDYVRLAKIVPQG